MKHKLNQLPVLVKSEMTQLAHQSVLLNGYSPDLKNQHLALLEKRSWLGKTFITQEITLFQALVWIEIFYPLKKMKELHLLYLNMLGLSRLQKVMKNTILDLKMLTTTLPLNLMKTWSIHKKAQDGLNKNIKDQSELINIQNKIKKIKNYLKKLKQTNRPIKKIKDQLYKKTKEKFKHLSNKSTLNSWDQMELTSSYELNWYPNQ